MTSRRLALTRAGLLLTAAPVVVLLSVAGAITVGPSELSTADVFGVVADRLGLGSSDLTLIQQGIVWDLRLPRTLLAGICGAGLAICGVILQSMLRNPLADPFVLGISSGASTGAVSSVVLGVGGGTRGLATGAFLGALASFALVMVINAVIGIVLSALYILVMVQRVAPGPETENVRGMADLRTREAFVVAPVIALILAVGVFPKPLFAYLFFQT